MYTQIMLIVQLLAGIMPDPHLLMTALSNEELNFVYLFHLCFLPIQPTITCIVSVQLFPWMKIELSLELVCVLWNA